MNEYSTEEESVAYSLLGVGGILRFHREKHAWSTEHVSSVLRLSIQMIEAIESEDWEKLPARVFVRGYIKAYAKFLHLDVEEVLAQFDKIEYGRFCTSRQINVVTLQPSISSMIHQYPGQILSCAVMLVVLVVVAVLFFFWPGSATDGTPIVLSEPQTSETAINDSPLSEGTADTQSMVDRPLPKPNGESEESTNLSADGIESDTTNEGLSNNIEEVTATGGATHRLAFTFTGECWLKVSDGTGKTIYQDTQVAGDKLVLNGQPPFSLHIGNAHVVEVFYNEQPISLVPHTHEDVAQLVLTP